MAGIFDYNPGVSDRSGELLAAGISQAGQSLGQGIGEGISAYERLNTAAKGADAYYKALGDAAPQFTGVPEDKWKSLGSRDKIAAMNAAQGTFAIKQSLAANSALSRILGAGATPAAPQSPAAPAGQPQFNVAPRPGGGPPVIGRLAPAGAPAPAPTQSPLDRINAALANNPQLAAAIVSNPQLAKSFGAITKLMEESSPPQMIDVNGVKVITKGNSIRPLPPSYTTPMQRFTGDAPPVNLPLPDGFVWKRGATGWEQVPKPKTASVNAGSALPKGTKLVVRNGFTYAKYPDGSMKPLHAMTPEEKTASESAQGGYTIGATYKGGLKYLGGDPTDQSSWQPTQ